MMISRGDHPWDVVRNNRLINNFLKSDADYFVKMDVDQVYPQDYFQKFLPLVGEYKVIGPLLYDRWKQNNFMPLAFSEYDYPKLMPMDLTGKTGIVDIPYSHTNLFYHREVLEKVPPPWYEAKLTQDGLDRANHVDYDFLNKIKNAGYPIYIDLDTVVRHMTIQSVGKNLYARRSDGAT